MRGIPTGYPVRGGAALAWVVAGIVVAGVGAGATYAQSVSSAIAGRVTDEKGLPVADAVVRAQAERTGTLRTTLTDEQGRYRLEALTPGFWIVVAQWGAQGGSEPRRMEVRLQRVQTLDFEVDGGLSERVTVRSDAPLVDTRKTGGMLRVTDEEADVLPLSGRNITDLALLDSAVRAATPGNYFGERAAVFLVNGQSGRANSFLVDGLDNNDQTSSTSLNGFYSQQVVEEFVLLTHQFAPEFGRASGGVMNIVTKQGGNQSRWGGFVQGTSRALNSTGDFVRSVAPQGQTAVQRFATGFNFSGPFKKDRAFYIVAYEHQQGDEVIPYTGLTRFDAPRTWGRAQNPQRGLRRTRQYESAPVDPASGGLLIAPARDDTLFFRADFNISTSKTLMVRLSASDRKNQGLNVGGITTPEGGFALDERDYQLGTTFTAVLSPRLLTETRFLAATSRFDQRAASDRPGVTRPTSIYGGNALNRQLREEDRFQIVENVTWMKGAHTMKFGFDVLRSHTRILARFNPNGNFLYETDIPFEPGECTPNIFIAGRADEQGFFDCGGAMLFDDDGDGLIDERGNIRSFPIVYTLIDGQPEAVQDDTRISLFAQDQWQVGPRWLLQYGLRYDLSTFTLPDDVYVPSSIDNGGASRDYDNLAPRFSFTWQPGGDGSLVVRGGAGVFYDKLVLAFPAAAAVTSGTRILFAFPQGFAAAVNEDTVEEGGNVPLAFIPELALKFSTAPELETPYTVQYTAGVEKAFGSTGAFRADLIHSLGYHLPLMLDLNPVVCVPDVVEINPDCPSPLPLHRDPTTGSIAAVTTEGRSWYTGLDLKYRWQREGEWFQAAYTLARAEDLGFDPLKGGIAFPPDSDNVSAERGRADGDRLHRLVLSGDFPLPWMGIRASGVFQFSSGIPFNVTTGQDDNLDGIASERPAGVGRNEGADSSLVAVNELRADPTIDLPPVDSLEEHAFSQVDLRVYKPFPLGGKGEAEVFLQVFNLLDAENIGVVEGRAVSRNFGQPIALAGPPRTVELGFRMGF